MPRAKYKIERKCTLCGKSFFALRIDAHLCSDYCRRRYFKQIAKEKQRQKILDSIESNIPDYKELISVRETIAIFAVGKDTIYRLIREGKIRHINLGVRLIRLFRSDLESSFTRRREALANNDRKLPKLYSLEPADCYTIGEVTKKFGISEKQVYSHIRNYSVPMRQIGRQIYVPKEAIHKIIENKQY